MAKRWREFWGCGLLLLGVSVPMRVFADNWGGFSITVDPVRSQLSATIPAEQLLHQTPVENAYHIVGQVELPNAAMAKNLYLTVNTTTLALVQGSHRLRVDLNGSIGNAPIRAYPFRVDFTGRKAPIDIYGRILPEGVSLSTRPGSYYGMLMITAIAL